MVKTLLKSVREYKKPSIITPLFMVGEAVCECAIPYIMSKMLLTNAEGTIPMKQLLLFGGLMILLAILSLICGIKGGKYAGVASCGFAKNLRKDLFYAVQRFSFKDVDRFSTSSLVTRLTTDVSNVQMAYQMCLRIVVRVPLMFTFSVIMSFITVVSSGASLWLSFVYLVLLPVLAVILISLMFKVMPFFRKIFKKYDALNNSVQENVGGIRVVKSFVREDYEKKKFDKASGEVKNDFTKAEKMIALTSPVMQFFMYTASVLISFIGARIVISQGSLGVDGKVIYGTFSPTQLSAVLTYGVQMLSSLMMFSMILVMFTMSVESGNRIAEVLECKSDLVSPENGVKEVKNGEVVFKNVNFKYSENAEKFALSDIDLTIPSGSTLGILGATGSSKTTLIQLIPRLYDTTEGEVTVGGVNVKEYDLDVLRKEVSVVLQKNVLFSGTVKENLRWGDENATDEDIKRVCDISQASEFLKDRPNRYVEQGGANVSGGQKQRLCIARALLRKPKILILDDSTSAVDTRTDALIRAGLKKEAPETTKIIIAQRVSSVEDADQIIVMDGGKIVERGNHATLMKKKGIYYEIYEAQTKKKVEDGEVGA